MLPGSEAAVRLAMERLILPELGHIVARADEVNAVDPSMRPFTRHAPARRRAAHRAGRGGADRRAPSACRSPTPTAASPRATCVPAIDVPPFDRAAMDGYAVVAADTSGAGTHAPKHADVRRSRVHRPGAHARRSAPASASRSPPARRCPTGADAVVMVEETDRDRRRAFASSTPVYPRQNIGRRGADIAAGQRGRRGRATC